uniref:Uncharacterized protein n=1 Tax=Anguilla anguilla TaxID=7936 RepID=A0A0E9TFG5_ANGAN
MPGVSEDSPVVQRKTEIFPFFPF